MTGMERIARKDLERLSAFMDGELSPAEAEKLQARLKTDQQLRGTLEALRATAAVVGGLPDVRPPRSFALTDEMVRPRRAYPILQLSTAMAALGFVLLVGADLVLNSIESTALEAPEQAFFAADELASQAEPQPTAAAPAQAPALEGAAMEQAAGEPAGTAVPQAESIEDLDAGAAPRYQGADEVAAAEPQADQGAAAAEGAVEEQLAGEGAAARDGAVEEQLAREGAYKADAEQEPLGELAAAQADLAEQEPPNSLGPVRVIEIGLAAVVVFLGGLTLWVRKRG